MVSSGAIAAGMAPLGFSKRPTTSQQSRPRPASGRWRWSMPGVRPSGATSAPWGRCCSPLTTSRAGSTHQRSAHPRSAAGITRGGDRQRERHGRNNEIRFGDNDRLSAWWLTWSGPTRWSYCRNRRSVRGDPRKGSAAADSGGQWSRGSSRCHGWAWQPGYRRHGVEVLRCLFGRRFRCTGTAGGCFRRGCGAPRMRRWAQCSPRALPGCRRADSGWGMRPNRRGR